MKRLAVINDTSANGHIGCYAVMSTLDLEFRSRGMQPVFYGPTGQDWRDLKVTLKKLAVDLVVVNGEGSIHNSAVREWPRSLAQVGTFSRQELGVRSVLLNATTWQLDGTTLRHIRDFDAVYVRETASQSYLSKYGVASEVVPDLSFFCQHEYDHRHERGDPVVVTDSVLSDISEQLAAFSEQISARFIRFRAPEPRGFQRLICRFKRLINTRTIQRKYIQHSLLKSDGTTFRGRPEFLEFMAVLRASQLLVTGRFHAMTLAIKAGTPFLAVASNTPKIAWVLSDIFHDKSRCIGIEDLQDILSRRICTEYQSLSNGELSQIDHYLNDGLVRKNSMFDQLAS